MKILMLGWELPPHNSGGLGVACYQLSKALASYGVQIDFVLPATTKSHNVDFMNVLPVTACQESHKDVYKLSYANKDITAIRTIQADYKAFVEHYLKTHETPHIIHAHDWLTLDAGVHAKKISGAPLIAHVHATEFDRSGGGYGNPFIHEVEQHGLMMADRIIAVSEYTKRLITETYHIPAEKIDVVHNSFACEEELTAAERISYRYLDMLKKDGISIVAAVGRLTLQKGLMQFLEAAAKSYQRYNRLAFVVAGNGEQRDELIAKAAELGIADQVIFTGFVRGAAWRQLYEIADMFVMSSISEPFGITALEAAAHGTPVVMTHQSGVAEVLTHSFKYNYWDTDRLADIMVNVASSRGLREAMVSNATTQLEGLSWQQMAERCLNVYHGVTRSAVHA